MWIRYFTPCERKTTPAGLGPQKKDNGLIFILLIRGG